jgi:hypothetical protein
MTQNVMLSLPKHIYRFVAAPLAPSAREIPRAARNDVPTKWQRCLGKLSMTFYFFRGASTT